MMTQMFISKIRLFSYDEADKDRISLDRNFVKATRRNDSVKMSFHVGRKLQSVLLTHQHLELKADNSYIKTIYHHNELEYEVDIVSYQRRYLVNYDKIEIQENALRLAFVKQEKKQ